MTPVAGSYDVMFYLPSVAPLLARQFTRATGGAETQVVALAQALASLGLRVSLVSYPAPGGIPRTVGGVDIHIRPTFMSHQPLTGKLREAKQIHDVVRAVPSQVVVTRAAGVQVGLVGLAAKVARRRFVYSSANVVDFDFGSLGYKLRDHALYRLGISLADDLIVQTDEQAWLAHRKFRRKAHVIKSIGPPPTSAPHEGEFLLWVGRAVWYKRPYEFIELARRVAEEKFVMIAAPGPGRDDLTEEIAAAAADLPNLTLLEPRPREQVMDVVGRALAIVNTSDFEGMPNTFLEAWAMGVPALVLSHDPDGVVERFRLGYAAHGSSSALADAARAVAGGAGRDAFGDNCRRYVEEHHSAHVIARQWADALGLAGRVAAEDRSSAVATRKADAA